MSPNKLRALLAKSSPAIVAMGGCGSCHYWGRVAESHGHEVRIIPAKIMNGFLQGGKTDANNASIHFVK